MSPPPPKKGAPASDDEPSESNARPRDDLSDVTDSNPDESTLAPLQADGLREADQAALNEGPDAKTNAESQATEQSEASFELRNPVQQQAGEDRLRENATLTDGNATISVGVQSARVSQGLIPRLFGKKFRMKSSSGRSKESAGMASDPELNSKMMGTNLSDKRPVGSGEAVKTGDSDDRSPNAGSATSQSPDSAPISRIIKQEDAAAENPSNTDNAVSNETDDPSRRIQRMMVDKVMSSFMDWLDVKLKVKEEEDESAGSSTYRPTLGSGQTPVTSQAPAVNHQTRMLGVATRAESSSNVTPAIPRPPTAGTLPKVALAKPQSPALASSAKSAPVTRSRGALRTSKSSLDSRFGGLGGSARSKEVDEPTISSLASPPRYYEGNSLPSQPLAAPAAAHLQKTKTNTAPLQEELELSSSLSPPPPGGVGGREPKGREGAAPVSSNISPLEGLKMKKKKKYKRVDAVEQMEEPEELKNEEDEEYNEREGEDGYDRAGLDLQSAAPAGFESYEEVSPPRARHFGQWKESPGTSLPPPPPLPAALPPALSRPRGPQDLPEAESPVQKKKRGDKQSKGTAQDGMVFWVQDAEDSEHEQSEAATSNIRNSPLRGFGFGRRKSSGSIQAPDSNFVSSSPYTSRPIAAVYAIEVGYIADDAPQPPASGTGTGSQSRGRKGPPAAKRGRPKRKDKDDEDDEDEDGEQAPRPKLPRVQEGEVIGAKLACPFFKHNPRKYKNQRPCCGPGWDHVHRIKEHIYRKHSLPKFSCPRCSQPFETQADMQAHARIPDPCEVKEPDVLDGITQDQEKKLRSRKKTSGKELTEAEKWTQVYRILFPDVREREIPSPYYNAEDAQTNLSGYEDYLRRELPTLVRRQLEVEVERELSFVEEGMKQKVIEIARNLQLTLFKGYQQLESREREGLEEASPSAGDVSSTETGGLSSFATTNTSPSTMTTAGTTPEMPDPLEIFGDDPAIPDFDFNFMADIPFPDAQDPPKELDPTLGMDAYAVPDQCDIQPGMGLYGGQKLDLPYYGMGSYGNDQDATGVNFPNHHLDVQAMSVNQAQAYQP